MSNGAIVLAPVVRVLNTLPVDGVQHIHRLVVHTRLDALIGQQQAALVNTDRVTHPVGQFDASADVVDGRVAHVRPIFLIQAPVQVVLSAVVIGCAERCFIGLNAVFTLTHIAVGILDGFIEFAILLLQVNGLGR